MRKIGVFLGFIAFVLVCQFLVVPVGAVDTQNFYFEDFTGDYYLTKDAEGISHLRVVENVTAVFPDYNQNKGICRQIASTNQGGVNVTLPNLDEQNLNLMRNGEPEEIYSITKGDDYYNVCTGTEEYVLGRQVYTFEYEFERVVTDYGDYQELYWDTNGNGATQRFDKVTARVHFDEETKSAYAGKQWCYVGKYGESGQNRCTITEIGDGVEFATSNLTSHENLTFDIELKPGSFVVPEPAYSYAYVWTLVVLAVVCGLCLIKPVKRFLATREKARYYKGLFVKPEYQPDAHYSLPEMAEIYIGKKKDVRVAMLLNLIVQKKVSIVKGEKKKWSLKVENLDGVREESIKLLELLNGGVSVNVGDEVEVKRRVATAGLASLNRDLEDKVVKDMKNDGLVEKDYRFGVLKSVDGVASIITGVIIYGLLALMGGFMVLAVIIDYLELNNFHGVMVYEEEFIPTALAIILVAVMVWAVLKNRTRMFQYHTETGLRASRYMDGLKLYIKMVEADRLKFLQSVEGADTSSEGIVKLYEELLPYAAVFGLEESWMKELAQYCELEEVAEPDWLTTGITANEISRMTHRAVGYATASTVVSSGGGISGGGGWSSSGSGGGGGGFSGGGGGGGGFSGR